MSTTVVSGRVNTSVFERAARIIRAAGLTPASVIKNLWECIAQTGRLPEFAFEEKKTAQSCEAFARFVEFSNSLPACSEEMTLATKQDIRRMAAEKHV